jgi:hypothetical protein
MLKFTTTGLYQVTCVVVADQPVSKVALGKTSTYTTWTALQAAGTLATTGYDYVYNYPVGSSPSEVVTLPINVSDISQYYYFDIFLSTVAGTPTALYPTRSTTAVGTNYGTYIQVIPFGSYVSSATSPSAGLLMTTTGTTLSSPLSSNTYRIAMTSANNWTVNGTSTAITITSGGNFQVNQAGVYEVSLCLNLSATPVQFGIGSLGSDTAPSTIGPYLYQYAPMYTQDPTTVISLPLNITSVSNYYYIDVTFPLYTSTVTLTSTSTYVMIRPIGTYLPPTNQVWTQQGSTAYYNGGPVGIGVVPTTLTETFTVSGNTSFISNVTVTSDVSSNTYVNARRIPVGSLSVANYVTGSVPLTTTTNLIQNYLSNAATIGSNIVSGTTYQVLNTPPSTATSYVNFGSYSSTSLANLAVSNLFIEAWVNLSTASGVQALCGRRQADGGATVPDFNLYFYAGQPNFIVSNVSGTLISSSNTTALIAGTWYHIAASWQRTGVNTGTVRVFTNGGIGGSTGSFTTGSNIRFTPTANTCISSDNTGNQLFGNVLDVRVMTNCIVPVATFTPPSFGYFTTAPTYRTGMNTGYTSNLTLALNSQYFPGASTSPYGPCLTLPGTVGSYYTETGTFLNTTLSSGFTIETWVNFASLANSNTFYSSTSLCSMIGKINPIASGSGGDWFFGPTTTGQVCLEYYNSSVSYGMITTGTITTGSWTHLVAQANTAGYVNMYINGVQQTLTAQNTAGSGTALLFNGTVSTNQYNGITVGQYYANQGPNFAIAKARVLFGANTYTTTTFTPNPNLGPIPAGATVAWQLESQYPLPTYPSIQDMTPLALQSSRYGAVPTPVGGVTSSTLGPFPTAPQLDSIQFDGTGYLDYGNAASSALTTNIWATPWTIEAWVYPTSSTGNVFSRSTDLSIGLSGGTVNFYYGSQTITGPAISLNQWTHIAATYDGTLANVYVGGTGTSWSGRFVAVSDGTTAAAYSNDGITWVAAGALPSAANWRSLTVNPTTGRFVALAQVSTAAAYSNDGITWQASTLPSSSSWRAVAVNPTTGRFVAVTDSQTAAAYSNDGITWMAAGPLPSSSRWLYVTVSPSTGRFVTVGYGSTAAAYSNDGITWVAANPLPSASNWYGLAFSPVTNRFVTVAYGSAAAAYSNDGITWQAATLPSSTTWQTLTCNPSTGRFVTIANSSTATAYSNDGITWVSGGALPSSTTWQMLTCNPTTGRFVTIANSSTATAYSNDGINWISGNPLPSTAFFATAGLNLVAGPFTPTASVQIGGPTLFTGNLADVRVSNVARYTGSSYTVPSVAAGTAPFVNDANTMLLLKSLGGQVGTTLEVQGRGLNAVSVGATRTTRAYPPAPMSSYLLDTTGNTAVTYGQGKYVASASTEFNTTLFMCWQAFDKNTGGVQWASATPVYSSSSPYGYTGSVTTVDTLGNSYAGEWLQIQMPVSIILTSYTFTFAGPSNNQNPSKWSILGSRDGFNWNLVNTQSGTGVFSFATTTFTTSVTQSYNYYRAVFNQISGTGVYYCVSIFEWTLNGTEESLCVTSDAKVGVGVANPQRSLEVAGDLVVGGTISGGAGMGAFRNRIINGDMRIAQRGTSTTAGGYLIDRFTVIQSITTGTVTYAQSNLASSDTPYQLGFRNYMNVYTNVGCSNYTYVLPYQPIEAYNMLDFNWGTSFGVPVTLSFWFRSNAPTGSVFNAALRTGAGGGGNYPIYITTFNVASSGAWQYVTFTVPPPPNGTSWNTTGSSSGVEVHIGGQYPNQPASTTVNSWISTGNYYTFAGAYNWPVLAGNFINITGVQLEKGTVATPFEFRPYATELALCQRYFEIGPNADRWFSTSTTSGRLIGRFVVPKRGNPTVAKTSMTYLAQSGSASFASGINQTMGVVTFTVSGITPTDFTSDYTNTLGTAVIPANGIFDVMTSSGQTGGLWTASAEL